MRIKKSSKNKFTTFLTLNILIVFMLSFLIPPVIAQTPDKNFIPPKEFIAPPPEEMIQSVEYKEPTTMPDYQPPPIDNLREPNDFKEPVDSSDASFMPPPEDETMPRDMYMPPKEKMPIYQEIDYPKPKEETYPEPKTIAPRPEDFMQQYPEYQEYPDKDKFIPPPSIDYFPPSRDDPIQDDFMDDSQRQIIGLPDQCREAGIMDKFECEKLMREKMGYDEKTEFPEEQAGFRRPSEMSETTKTGTVFIPPPPMEAFKMMLPRECQEAGTATKEECDKIMRKKFELGENIEKMDIDQAQNFKEPPKEMIMLLRPPIGGFGFKPDFKEMKQNEIKMRVEMKMRSGEANECKDKNANECRQILQEKMEKEMKNKEYMPPECEQAGITDQKECEKIMMAANLPPPCREAGISDPNECKTFMFSQNMPPECQKQGITDPEECEKSMIKKHMPPECQTAGAATPEECDKIMMAKHMPPECQQAGIKDMRECEKFMAKSYSPKICTDQGAFSPTECDKIIIQTFGEPEGCEGLSEFKCMQLMKQGKAGQNIMAQLNSNLPPKCVELGAKTMFECEELSMKKNVPAECKEAGVFTKEACDKVMFEKYRPEDETVSMPQPCIDAGAKTPMECDEIMETLYMPMECKKANITNKKECDILLQKLHTPPECQAVGAYDRESCEKIMRAKFMAPECKKSGITNPDACQAMMMEKYAKKIKCQGIDDDLCKIAIEKRHLGKIVKQQKKVQEIKEKINPLINKHIKIKKQLVKSIEKTKKEITPEQLPEKVEQEKMAEDVAKFIPIAAEKEVNLLILPSVEESTILEDETIVQTVPAIIMFDNDEDNVPNDVEERLGTDPENADTDNDGYQDGEEFKNNYNPLGEGDIWQSEIAQEISDFDKAIFNEKTMGQPLVSGEEAPEELAVQSAVEVTVIEPETMPEDENPAETESTGFFNIKKVYAKEIQKAKIKLQGKAAPNTVIAIFIYSDLAIVATSKTDEFGKWEYIVDQPLADGEHTVYIATLSSAGKIIKKSSGFPLFIKETRAITAQELISNDMNIKTNFNYWQLIVIIALIAAVLALAYLLYRRKQGKDINFIKP